MALAAPIRSALARLIDATATGRVAAAAALPAVIAATGSQLDEGARSELNRLAATLAVA
jgi:hypothetical protein